MTDLSTMTAEEQKELLGDLLDRHSGYALDVLKDKFAGMKVKNTESAKIPVDTIRDEVCEKYHIHLSMLGVDGRERKQDIEAEARRAYAWCLQQYAGLTLKEIARLLGLQDHTTVVYALKKVDKSFVPFLQLQAELIRMKAGRDG